jgi:hypothetical protein
VRVAPASPTRGEGGRRVSGCIFDGVSPTTNAHVFRMGWIAQMFPTAERFRHVHTRHEVGHEFDAEWRNERADFKVNCVCARCNDGWMERLDVEAEDIFLTRAVMGVSAKITSPTEKRTVARWCVLIGILFDQGQATPRIGPPVHQSLHAGDVPDGVWVWLAHTEPTDDAPHAWASVKDIELSIGIGGGTVDVRYAYFISFGIGHLVVQVLIPTDQTTAGIGFERLVDASIVRQLWPDLLTPLIWPPPQPLPWAEMDQFTRTFRTIDRMP